MLWVLARVELNSIHVRYSTGYCYTGYQNSMTVTTWDESVTSKMIPS